MLINVRWRENRYESNFNCFIFKHYYGTICIFPNTRILLIGFAGESHIPGIYGDFSIV